MGKQTKGEWKKINPEKIDEIARELVKKREYKTGLCHYTSLEGFQGMLNSISLNILFVIH